MKRWTALVLGLGVACAPGPEVVDAFLVESGLSPFDALERTPLDSMRAEAESEILFCRRPRCDA